MNPDLMILPTVESKTEFKMLEANTFTRGDANLLLIEENEETHRPTL